MADLTQSLRDAAYIGIGFGVIGFQKAQVLRHDLTKQVKARMDSRDLDLDLRFEGLGELGDKLQPVLGHAAGLVEQAAGRARAAGHELAGRIR